MKPQYFVALLFATSLYWMYLLYAPFLLAITIAILLAISTSNIQNFFLKYLKNRFYASFTSTFLLAILFFVPLGYFLITLSVKLNNLDPQILINVKQYILTKVDNPPEFLIFAKPYIVENIQNLDIASFSKTALSYTGTVGAFSIGFLKNSFLMIVFYFFVLHNGDHIFTFLRRVVQMSVDESSTLIKELSSVMGVVFYSIIVNAMLQGILFGLAISFLGYNGVLFGVMYGFASLIPIIGGAVMWLPFMLFEFSLGNESNGIFIALYSVIMISIVADTFIKPLIIKEINKRLLKEDDARVDELVIFFAIIAGLATFGFWGMILGPAITAFFLTLLKLFEARSKEFMT
ncbi:MAG: AI-2E family transporter [Sulfurimonas sp. RIFOXYD12_FULL_33_39]|uniref:AI-2E family transporter n=1 Tax=unclassified Sulfurimonas TaxID=2623549 RepID=UPI0008C4CC3D|nr:MULTISPECIES: AI-2E family transporter [unclassified Sulfurimonas]OHE06669.1 MAG: AI-2E family transporter [Sulfurimonas sp. RIFCSPLOWO2_12_FULL_34_6]OHE10528.1 MAG: AI-2E family transporter [Sulfurimonas sp. RIFOXYD12_FULL_33_39]OHE14987.1 MAG: AI-2E family transporter [Sulfurimonas sp. RIFOXYD2_FULL_34_21]DAB27745.1 MAG TPA: AI-2E family transporter [Sulfurimonas sp. UBA10385]